MKKPTKAEEKARRIEEFKAAGQFVEAMRAARKAQAINIIFDGPPGQESGRFVEVETDDGHSVNIGKWKKSKDGLWSLRIEAGFLISEN